MKSKLSAALAAACGAVTCIAVLSASVARADTTYNYVGSLYGFYSSGTDPALFGAGMTASVTFDFDTTGLSGSFGGVNLGDPTKFTIPGQITDVQLTSGIFSTHRINFAKFVLTSGEITQWEIETPVGAVSCGYGFAPACAMQSSNTDLINGGDWIVQQCTSCDPPRWAVGGGGTWAAVQVPGPIVGAIEPDTAEDSDDV